MTRFLFSATSRIAVILMLVGFASVSIANGPAPSIDTFDVPNATATYPTGINSAGQITGYYLDTTGQQHGFVRSKKGLITTFDVPGSTSTVPQAINQAGQITGYSDGPIFQRSFLVRDVVRGFVRQPDGTITLFDSCHTIDGYPDSNYTRPQAINPAGDIAGLCHQDSGSGAPDSYDYGFVRQADGTTLAIPYSSFSKMQSSQAVAINPGGQVTGFYFPGCAIEEQNAGRCGPMRRAGFVEQPDGSLSFFDAAVPGSGSQTLPEAINPAGQITGAYCGGDCTSYSGFLRQKDGTIASFTPAGSVVTRPQVINPSGQITGFYADAGNFYHGFLRERDGTIFTFVVANATNTSPTAMSPSGQVTGWYSDASGNVHGFVRSH